MRWASATQGRLKLTSDCKRATDRRECPRQEQGHHAEFDERVELDVLVNHVCDDVCTSDSNEEELMGRQPWLALIGSVSRRYLA